MMSVSIRARCHLSLIHIGWGCCLVLFIFEGFGKNGVRDSHALKIET
jgi:hypothetical protein